MEEPSPAADTPRRLAVADLLLLRRPTTGASSLHFPSAPVSTAHSTSPPRKKPKLAAAASSNPASKPSTAPFAPISHPVLLSGMLSLPSAASPAACRNSTSPSSSSPPAAASVCCCILDFDPAALGREIRVLAWNYLPSVRLHGTAGVLEVVRWCLVEEPTPAPKPAFLATIPLKCAPKNADLAARNCVFGVLRSVSAVFSMPRVKSDGSGSSVGFLAELICCGCRQCQKSPPKGDQGHNFEAVKFLYFIESASTWRPVLTWLVGKLVYISGLKKQMVSVREKASYTMLVSSTKTTMAWGPSYRVNLPSDCLPENCGGVYAGVITGIFMQGAVVELDNAVWLLIDDQELPPSHSLRVGAVISVKNFRTINLKLSWTRIVLLATCSKTNITVKYFSMVDSKTYMKTESKSLLGKFVESLDMPARFWILLLISCFKQKFTKLFSDKEILGSQNVCF
ncbi:hypothetical protein PR202_ga15982 [Eleusine coracana subsp. coracana]|uniref:CST complex subunit CTC1 n=1 Tax=Eleusine coracana subsp. coracana TaxID=191504 RepID=A0AAV5CM08_ELECO|nr:hypothetical protein PR202_ga15982 [Eleusine coracana subsp. coracana]